MIPSIDEALVNMGVAPPTVTGASPGRHFGAILGQVQRTFRESFTSGSALLSAVLDGDAERARRLVRESSARADERSASGQTALQVATMAGRLDLVQIFLEPALGADIDATDDFGNTALHWARMCDAPVIADLLLRRGGSPDLENLFGGAPGDYERMLAGAESAEEAPLVLATPRGVEVLPPSVARARFGWTQILESEASHELPFALFLEHAVDTEARDAVEVLGARPDDAPKLGIGDYGRVLKFGITALEDIDCGRYLGSYLGEVKTMARLRDEREGRGPHLYLANVGPSTMRFGIQIDGESRGGLLARMNSSSCPGTENVTACGGWRGGVPTVDFYAKTSIRDGAQLLWYYGAEYFHALEAVPVAA